MLGGRQKMYITTEFGQHHLDCFDSIDLVFTGEQEIDDTHDLR